MKAGFKRGPMPAEHKAKIAAANTGRFGYRGGGRPKNTPEVLWSKVDKRGPDECWPWKGSTKSNGYGAVEIDGRCHMAHRVIFALVHPGSIPLAGGHPGSGTLCVMHTCDNPPCCNPAHLMLGTHADNMADKRRKGRCPDFAGERGPRAKLTMEDAREIRRVDAYGISRLDLAALFGVSRATVQAVIDCRHYREAANG